MHAIVSTPQRLDYAIVVCCRYVDALGTSDFLKGPNQLRIDLPCLCSVVGIALVIDQSSQCFALGHCLLLHFVKVQDSLNGGVLGGEPRQEGCRYGVLSTHGSEFLKEKHDLLEVDELVELKASSHGERCRDRPLIEVSPRFRQELRHGWNPERTGGPCP